MAKDKPRFYILHGEDEFTLSQTVHVMRDEMKMVDSAGLNTSELDGSQVTAADVISQASVMPFLADRRLIIVRGMLQWITRKGAGETGKKQVERLLDELPYLPAYARLVFVENKTIPKTSKLIKLANSDPNGYEKEFAAPKDLTGWLMKRARSEYETELEPPAAHALASVIGGDLRRADNELFKLVSYTGGQAINEEHVALLTPYTSETRIWDMIDAMAARQGEKAMSMLHHILAEPDEDPFRIWALLVRQFRFMLLAKEHLEAGGTSATLPDALGMKEFQTRKFAAQVRPFSLENLETIYRKILEYDTNIKTGKMSILLALDILVATVAR